MLSHDNYGFLLMLSMWTNPWTGEKFGAFESYDGIRVNLPLSEVKVIA